MHENNILRNHERRNRATQAWDLHDFGDMVVKDYDNGWLPSERGGLLRTFYAEMPDDQPSRRLTFEVRFAPSDGVEVHECLVY